MLSENPVLHTTTLTSAEALRLSELAGLQILDSAPEQSFDDLLQLLVQITGRPIAMINFLDDKRLWAKAAIGIDVQEIPRKHSFCTHTIEGSGIMVVEDATQDARFFQNSLVDRSDGMRFYAGIPIFSESEIKLGAVCLLDTKPGKLTDAEAQALQIVARQIAVLLELRQKNIRLARWAEEKLALEQATIMRQIQQHEDERELIGFELHENFAQSIAAALQYLSLVKTETPETTLQICNVRQVLTGLLNGVRQLSATVFPIGSAGVIREEMFRQYIRQYNKRAKIQVYFECEGDTWVVSPLKLLALFRIMVEHLQVYELQDNTALKVQVLLEVDSDVRMRISTTGAAKNASTMEAKVLENSIHTRSKLQNGRVYRAMDENQNQVLDVRLPL